MKIRFLSFIIICFTGCAAINRPLDQNENPVPILDFQSGTFIEKSL